jgi:hypothetical protein
LLFESWLTEFLIQACDSLLGGSKTTEMQLAAAFLHAIAALKVLSGVYAAIASQPLQ